MSFDRRKSQRLQEELKSCTHWFPLLLIVKRDWLSWLIVRVWQHLQSRNATSSLTILERSCAFGVHCQSLLMEIIQDSHARYSSPLSVCANFSGSAWQISSEEHPYYIYYMERERECVCVVTHCFTFKHRIHFIILTSFLYLETISMFAICTTCGVVICARREKG